MTKINLLLMATVLALTGGSTDAARLIVEPPTVAADGAYALYVAGEEHNGNFDTVIFSARPNDGATFANPDPIGVVGTSFRHPGDKATFINALLFAPGFGGQPWSGLGLEVTETNMEFTAGPLGRTIDTSAKDDGRQFIANVWLPDGTATANAQIVRAGEVVQDITTSIPVIVPEPATMLIIAFAMASHAGVRRRNPSRPAA